MENQADSPPALTRNLLLAGAAAMVVVGAVVVFLHPWTGAAPPPATTSAPATSPAAAVPEAAAEPHHPEAAAEPPRPGFDVVRVNDEGSAVIAGRATAHATVTILDNGSALGQVAADDVGQFVFLPEQPLPSGGQQLTLSARAPDGSISTSEAAVLLLVPDRTADAATQPSAPVAVLAGPDSAPRLLTPAPEAPAQPQSTQPQPAPTQAAQSETAQSETAQSETAQSETAQSQAGAAPAGVPSAEAPAITHPADLAAAAPPPAAEAALRSSGAEGIAHPAMAPATVQASAAQAAVPPPLASAPIRPSAATAAVETSAGPIALQPSAAPAAGKPPAAAGAPQAPAVIRLPEVAGLAPVPEPQLPAPAADLLTPPAPPAAAAPAAPAPAALHRRLGLEVVDYDDRGAIRFAGGAPAGSTVRLYIDNHPAGDAMADAAGAWTLTPPATMPLGVHRLRVDEINAQGRVTARVEQPFQRSIVDPASIGRDRVLVQPGQNLWRLARVVYGSGTRYTVIYQANRDQIRDPRLIYPGQAFAVPAVPGARAVGSNPASIARSR